MVCGWKVNGIGLRCVQCVALVLVVLELCVLNFVTRVTFGHARTFRWLFASFCHQCSDLICGICGEEIGIECFASSTLRPTGGFSTK
jgi:hypothetical protein